MSKTILLADDSVTIQKVIELTFMDQDHRVAAVSSGDEALARLAESKPDFVIADVHMPGASGYAVARRSKELYPDVPVLLLVGTFEAFDEAKAEASGAEDVLKKPFDSQELLRLVEQLSSKAAPSASASPESAVSEPATPQADADTEADPFDWQEDTAPGLTLDAGTSQNVNLSASAEAEPEPFPDLKTPAPEHGREGSLLDTFAPASSPAQAPEPAFEVADEPAEDEPSEVEAPAEESAASPLPSLSWEPAEEEEAPAEEAEVAEAADSAGPPLTLSDEDVERIARRVADLVGEKLVRQVAWDVVPDLAEVIIRDRLRELESQVE
jgi:CheY-like chemotaxis protein